MRLRDLCGRLDAYFRPAAFDEHEGRDFCFAPGEWEALLARAPAAFAATCNGLMITPGDRDPEIGQVADPRRLVHRGAGHIPYATRPDDYAATVLAFISRGPMF
jgi:hypothetical protein